MRPTPFPALMGTFYVIWPDNAGSSFFMLTYVTFVLLVVWYCTCSLGYCVVICWFQCKAQTSYPWHCSVSWCLAEGYGNGDEHFQVQAGLYCTLLMLLDKILCILCIY